MSIRTQKTIEEPEAGARARAVLLLKGAVGGAAVTYLLDHRERGRRDRQHATATVRRLRRDARRSVRRTRGRLKGLEHRVRPSCPHEVDDMGLAHRVESSVYRDARVPKGLISVNAENGTIYLRGAVTGVLRREEIGTLVGGVPGVERVVNLLHEPGTPAPTVP